MPTTYISHNTIINSAPGKSLVNNNHEKDQTTPKYEIVARDLLDLISTLPDGQEYLPYEKELMRQFNVCRGTVTRALAILRQRGFIETARKRGSRVLRRPEQADLQTSLAETSITATTTVSTNTESTGNVAILLGYTPEEADTRRGIRWPLISQLEGALLPTGTKLLVYNLRENNWATWRDPQVLASSLTANSVSWVVVRPHVDAMAPLDNLLDNLIARQIKPVLCGADVNSLILTPYLFRPGVDYVLGNHFVAILQALQQNYCDADCIVYLDNAAHADWSDPRQTLISQFATQRQIEYHHLRSPYQLLFDADRANQVNCIDLDTSQKLLKIMDKQQRGVCFAANDYTASSLLRQLTALNHKSRNFRLVGHDNDPQTRHLNLSTFDVSPIEQTLALQSLRDSHFRDPTASLTKSCGTIIPARFILREMIF